MAVRPSHTVAFVIGAALLVAATRHSAIDARTAPPSRVADQAPVLSPEEEMKTFRLPAGYRVELVASEPMIEEPVVIDWDTEGRLWVVEMLGYMQDMPSTIEREPIGRISVLEDENGDGRMDKKTVFLDGLVLPRALKVLDRGVLVGEPPNLWFARDTDGDLRADTKALVTSSFGRLEGNVEHNANTLLWALDNWIHTSETDIYFRFKKGTFETRKTAARGQWGASQDDAGRIYRNTNESVLHVDVVPTPYYARNPSLLRTRGSYESLRGDKNEVMTVWPAHPTPGVNRGYQSGVLRQDGTLAAYSSVSAPTVYRGDRLPPDVYGDVFVVEPAGNLVSRIVVSDDGTRMRARKAYEGSEFLASTDERFRPVYLSNAPDGNLYLVDMYRGIIQHKAYITEYLRDQILSRRLDAPPRHGRIYRIVYGGIDAPRPRPISVAKAPPGRLVELLSHANGWWRDTAQRLLVERAETSAVPALRRLAQGSRVPRTRLHALWTLDGLDALPPGAVLRALEDPSRDVRASAVRLAERHMAEPGSPLQAAVLKHVHDPDWIVRAQVAASIGALPPGLREKHALAVLQEFGGDPLMVDATLSGLQGGEPAVLAALLQSTEENPQRSATITMLAGTIVKGGREALVHDVFQRVAQDVRPMWQRSALMRGVEAALLGASMPGGGGGRGRGANAGSGADSEAGGRAGPGGAPAFPRAPSAPRSATVTALKLNREPALLAVVARDEGDLGKRATAVLRRIEWPGKVSSVPVAAPLTETEQQRFEAGKQIYQTLCSACHQPDGRGQERVAPSLVGSDLALGPAGIPSRIVLNGKEGPVGLMPPLGSVLSDDQIAAALTYIRREWGHTAPAVDPSIVKNVRAQFAGRARPWTVDELSDLLNNGRGAPQRH